MRQVVGQSLTEKGRATKQIHEYRKGENEEQEMERIYFVTMRALQFQSHLGPIHESY